MVNINPNKIAKAAKLSKLVKQEIVENAGYDFYGLRRVVKESGIVLGAISTLHLLKISAKAAFPEKKSQTS